MIEPLPIATRARPSRYWFRVLVRALSLRASSAAEKGIDLLAAALIAWMTWSRSKGQPFEWETIWIPGLVWVAISLTIGILRAASDLDREAREVLDKERTEVDFQARAAQDTLKEVDTTRVKLKQAGDAAVVAANHRRTLEAQIRDLEAKSRTMESNRARSLRLHRVRLGHNSPATALDLIIELRKIHPHRFGHDEVRAAFRELTAPYGKWDEHDTERVFKDLETERLLARTPPIDEKSFIFGSDAAEFFSWIHDNPA